ncbi:hypothetical protein HPP92_018316 [Vanilla planifolia]|uniref:B3 domain-containing protein n=1 Tax=Vanilla planifolia TaxID=51239 RepID=A0A835UPA0_VANPL|nr:hypothetical protein HPP92_018316 [Vanilla planifolia]
MNSRQEPDKPRWARRVAGQHKAHDVWYLFKKKITSSDVHKHQHRLLIGKSDIYDRLLPAMSEEEKKAASFPNHPGAGIRRHRPDHLAGGERGPREVGRNHGGLEVMVYDQRGQGCRLLLTRWDGSGAAVLKGKNYENFLRKSRIEEGDDVEVWAFRDEDEKLCFVVGNITVLSLLSLQIS